MEIEAIPFGAAEPVSWIRKLERGGTFHQDRETFAVVLALGDAPDEKRDLERHIAHHLGLVLIGARILLNRVERPLLGHVQTQRPCLDYQVASHEKARLVQNVHVLPVDERNPENETEDDRSHERAQKTDVNRVALFESFPVGFVFPAKQNPGHPSFAKALFVVTAIRFFKRIDCQVSSNSNARI